MIGAGDERSLARQTRIDHARLPCVQVTLVRNVHVEKTRRAISPTYRKNNDIAPGGPLAEGGQRRFDAHFRLDLHPVSYTHLDVYKRQR